MTDFRADRFQGRSTTLTQPSFLSRRVSYAAGTSTSGTRWVMTKDGSIAPRSISASSGWRSIRGRRGLRAVAVGGGPGRAAAHIVRVLRDAPVVPHIAEALIVALVTVEIRAFASRCRLRVRALIRGRARGGLAALIIGGLGPATGEQQEDAGEAMISRGDPCSRRAGGAPRTGVGSPRTRVLAAPGVA